MAISYDKLFDLLKARSLQKTDLLMGAGLAPATLAKLSKNQAVSLQIILKICQYLQVHPGIYLPTFLSQRSLLYSTGSSPRRKRA